MCTREKKGFETKDVVRGNKSCRCCQGKRRERRMKQVNHMNRVNQHTSSGSSKKCFWPRCPHHVRITSASPHVRIVASHAVLHNFSFLCHMHGTIRKNHVQQLRAATTSKNYMQHPKTYIYMQQEPRAATQTRTACSNPNKNHVQQPKHQLHEADQTKKCNGRCHG